MEERRCSLGGDVEGSQKQEVREGVGESAGV